LYEFEFGVVISGDDGGGWMCDDAGGRDECVCGKQG